MGNAAATEIREFGTGLRDYLELRGVRLDVRLVWPSNLDLFALSAVLMASPQAGMPALQPREAHGVGLLAA
jgi:hypothetical protein